MRKKELAKEALMNPEQECVARMPDAVLPMIRRGNF